MGVNAMRWRWPAATLSCLLSVSVNAEYELVETNWELGVGVGLVSAPDYPGSREYRYYVSPVPYLTYSGRFLQSDRAGVRGDFLRTDQFELSVSMAATITPDSRDNEKREGMSPLDSSFEIGPAININLTGADLERGWLLHLPTRAVFSVGRRSPDYIGWLSQVQLAYRTEVLGWSMTYRGGLYHVSRAYSQYYYSVDDEFATETRPAYHAKPGYGGTGHQLALSRSDRDFRYGLYVRYTNLDGARFVDSPLVETRHALSGGLALVWIFRDSDAGPLF